MPSHSNERTAPDGEARMACLRLRNHYRELLRGLSDSGLQTLYERETKNNRLMWANLIAAEAHRRVEPRRINALPYRGVAISHADMNQIEQELQTRDTARRRKYEFSHPRPDPTTRTRVRSRATQPGERACSVNAARVQHAD